MLNRRGLLLGSAGAAVGSAARAQPFFPVVGASIPRPNVGVNLNGAEFGGTFPGTFGTDYTYPTNQELDWFKSRYMGVIRLTFRWERMQPTLSAALDASELARMDTFLNAAAARGLKVVPSITNFGGYGNAINPPNKIAGGTVTSAQFNDFWTRMATHYKGHPALFGYGIMGEPVGMPFGTWKTSAQSCVTAIRAVDGATAIVVGGDNSSAAGLWNQAPTNAGGIAQGGNSTFLLTDPTGTNNVIYDAHCYFDSDQSGTYATTFALDGATNFTGATRFKIFATWCQQNGTKGFIGEFGCPNNNSDWVPCLSNFCQAMVAANVSGCMWGGGPWWGDAYTLGIEPTPTNNGLGPFTADRVTMTTLRGFDHK